MPNDRKSNVFHSGAHKTHNNKMCLHTYTLRAIPNGWTISKSHQLLPPEQLSLSVTSHCKREVI